MIDFETANRLATGFAEQILFDMEIAGSPVPDARRSVARDQLMAFICRWAQTHAEPQTGEVEA